MSSLTGIKSDNNFDTLTLNGVDLTTRLAALDASLNAGIINLNGKQDQLTFNGPASNNTNPSTSAQIKTELDFRSSVYPQIVASATVLVDIGAGAISTQSTKNISITRNSLGRYTATMPTGMLTNNLYAVNLTLIEGSGFDDILIQFDGTITPTATSFSYHIHEQDNSTLAGLFRDRSHYVTVVTT